MWGSFLRNDSALSSKRHLEVYTKHDSRGEGHYEVPYELAIPLENPPSDHRISSVYSAVCFRARGCQLRLHSHKAFGQVASSSITPSNHAISKWIVSVWMFM